MKRIVWLAAALGVSALMTGCGSSEKPPETTAADPGKAEAPKAGTAANPPAKAEPRTVTLAEGTKIIVRTTNTLSTKTHESGQTFAATLEEPLVEGPRVIAPKGARVEGTITNSDDGGKVKGRASIAVRLTKIDAGGNDLDIRTSSVVRQAAATKKKDAMKVGIATGVGAAIGALAGGGKGAAIGAGAGAGAGTGAVLLTKGDPAVIPAESVLTFVLREPVTVR